MADNTQKIFDNLQQLRQRLGLPSNFSLPGQEDRPATLKRIARARLRSMRIAIPDHGQPGQVLLIHTDDGWKQHRIPESWDTSLLGYYLAHIGAEPIKQVVFYNEGTYFHARGVT